MLWKIRVEPRLVQIAAVGALLDLDEFGLLEHLESVPAEGE
jgi:hypothetical protein